MCGIAGILSLTDQRPDPALVGQMLERLVHRGPDDEGCDALGPVVLGMRRLSILDPTPRGHQPMTSADGRYTIVHNGEIYNFLELADELTPWATPSRPHRTPRFCWPPTRPGARIASSA